jgi:hypothetical protein
MEMIQLAAMPLRNAIQKEYVVITPSKYFYFCHGITASPAVIAPHTRGPRGRL